MSDVDIEGLNPTVHQEMSLASNLTSEE
jgi:hypothetical protein